MPNKVLQQLLRSRQALRINLVIDSSGLSSSPDARFLGSSDSGVQVAFDFVAAGLEVEGLEEVRGVVVAELWYWSGQGVLTARAVDIPRSRWR